MKMLYTMGTVHDFYNYIAIAISYIHIYIDHLI